MTRRRTPRRGLVLGAGGVLGSAWMIGALHAYQSLTCDDPRSFDLIIGTSAGSVVSSLLALGVDIDTMADSERGQYAPGTPVLDYRHLGRSRPPAPRLRMGSPRLLAAGVRHPQQLTPMVALAALLPQGRGQLAAIGDLVTIAHDAAAVAAHAPAAVAAHNPAALAAHEPAALAAVETAAFAAHETAAFAALETAEPGSSAAGQQGGASWPSRLRVVAMDFDTGGRVLFGADGAPPVALSRAVMASCAIPGWYAPVSIAGRRFIDGGTRSPTSLDLCLEQELDEILVLAPACAFAYDRPRHPVAVVERQLRRAATRRLTQEITLVEATGARVRVLCPGPADLAVMGGNVMDLARRERVFETSLRTSAAAFADLSRRPATPPGRSAASAPNRTAARSPAHRPGAAHGHGPTTRSDPIPRVS